MVEQHAVHHRTENTERVGDATESDHPPGQGAPIWLKHLAWQHCYQYWF